MNDTEKGTEKKPNNNNNINEKEIEEDPEMGVNHFSNGERESKVDFDNESELEVSNEQESSELTLDDDLGEIIEADENSEVESNGIEKLPIPEIEEETLKLEIRDIYRNLIEGALYAAGRPLDVEELATKLEIPKKEVEELVNELAYDYLERISALIINQVGEKFQMALRPEYVEKVSKFAKGGGIAERYLRTLTIIALKQPILKSTVIKLRGSGAYEHVKYLIDNDLISAVKKGRSQELSTTDKYSDMFGLPKNKQELKKMMITQLGIGEGNKE